MAPSFDWWAKGVHKGTPVVVKMDNPDWSMVELEGPSEDDFLIGNNPTDTRAKARGKNAKQLTWVLLLKAHRAAGYLTSVASTLASIGPAIRRRVASGRTDTESASSFENKTVKTRFYNCIKVFLWFSLFLLGFEIAAYYKGWHFRASNLQLQYIFTAPFGVRDFFDWLYSNWVLIRVGFVAPPLQFLVNVCIVLFLIQSLDRLILCLCCFWIRVKKIKPIPKEDTVADLETGENGFFPMVLVQIPMCNEREVKTKKNIYHLKPTHVLFMIGI